MKHITKKQALLGVFSFFMVGTLSFLMASNMKKSDATMAGFSAGNIISDYVMGNYNSMNESQIQAFLKSKNSCNDTGTYKAQQYPNYSYHIVNGHFVCMADENFNGESAAHIIWQAAQDYRINPQVLIVLLQKEQGLVTDTWPNSLQYRSATGYGCPDTAACDSQYYGLKNQIRNAAELYRWVLDHGSKYYPVGWNNVRFSPNAACGSSRVNIENNATAALYQYTPYQPNAAAINAGYGTGDACSAYGNRNFYNYFTDWFGSTRGSGFISLDTPRYFEITKDFARINPYTLQDTGDSKLINGQEIKFTTKIYTELGWCFRTEHNTNNGIFACVPQDKLKEVTLTYEDIPKDEQIKTISSNTHKTLIRAKDAVQNFDKQIVRTFNKRITFQGTTYYVTKFDYENSNSEYGVPEQYLTNGPDYKYQDFDQPREMEITENSKRINPITTEFHDNLSKDKVLKFASKIYWNNQWYYRTEYGTDNDENVAISASSVRELPEKAQYEYFEKPHEMILISNVNRINLTDKHVYDSLNIGRKISFMSRIYTNGQWYYRTEYNTNEQTNYVVPISALNEIYTKMTQPKYFTVVRQIDRINATTGEKYDTLEAGKLIQFSSQIYINNKLYYRTSYNTEHNENLVIPADALIE